MILIKTWPGLESRSLLIEDKVREVDLVDGSVLHESVEFSLNRPFEPYFSIDGQERIPSLPDNSGAHLVPKEGGIRLDLIARRFPVTLDKDFNFCAIRKGSGFCARVIRRFQFEIEPTQTQGGCVNFRRLLLSVDQSRKIFGRLGILESHGGFFKSALKNTRTPKNRGERQSYTEPEKPSHAAGGWIGREDGPEQLDPWAVLVHEFNGRRVWPSFREKPSGGGENLTIRRV